MTFPDHQTIALFLGYATLYIGGASIVAALLIGATMLVNRAMWRLVDCYGGFPAFIKYRDWYNNNERDK